jgi:hypothetical protein
MVSRRSLATVSRRPLVKVSRQPLATVSRRSVATVSRRSLAMVSRRSLAMVSRRPLTAEDLVRSQACPSGNYGGRSGNGSRFFSITWVLQYVSTSAPYC